MNGPTDEAAKIVFHLGGVKGSLQLDNIRLVRNSIYFVPDTVFYPLVNGDFSDALNAWQLVNPEGGGASSVVEENEEAKLMITNSGTKPHSVLFFQEGLSLSKGVTYIVEFDARSTMDRNMKVTVENASYTAHFSQTVHVSEDTQHYQFEFQAPAKEKAGLKFLLGDVGDGAINQYHEVYLDNVNLRVKDAPVKKAPELKADTTDNTTGNDIKLLFKDDELWRSSVSKVKVNGIETTNYQLEPGYITLSGSHFSSDGKYEIVIEADSYAKASLSQQILSGDGNLVSNGSFDEGTTSWVTWIGDGGVFDFSVQDGTAQLNISAIGPNNWSNQFYQEGIPMTAGKTYELSFKAWSTVERDFIVELSNNSGAQFQFNPSVTSEVYKVQFTATSNQPLKLNFLIGKGIGSFVVPHILFLDDISIIEIKKEE
ncbi:Carbohydrate binding domain protein [compost metagenome]